MSGFLFLILLVLLGGLAWVVVARLHRGKPRSLAGPVCGACGYSTQGLTTLTCPECGGDFRAVGIVTPLTPRRGMRFVPAAILFTGVMLLVALPLSAIFISSLPPLLNYTRTYALTGPPSQAYASVTARVRASRWGNWASDPTVDLVLDPRPPAGAVATQPAANVVPLRVTSRDDRGRPLLDPSTVLVWLGSAGINTSDPRVTTEATRIAAAGREIGRAYGFERRAAGGWGRGSSGSDPMAVFSSFSDNESASGDPPVWGVVLLALVWVGLWALGLRYLRRATPR